MGGFVVFLSPCQRWHVPLCAGTTQWMPTHLVVLSRVLVLPFVLFLSMRLCTCLPFGPSFCLSVDFSLPLWPSPLPWLHLCSSVCISLLFLVHRPVCLVLESGCDFFTLLKKKKIYHCHVCGVAEVEVTELSCLKFSSIILNISKIVHFGLRGELLIKQCKSIVVCFSYMTPNSTVFYFLPMTKAYLLSK